jgi:hypothetical protein
MGPDMARISCTASRSILAASTATGNRSPTSAGDGDGTVDGDGDGATFDAATMTGPVNDVASTNVASPRLVSAASVRR